MIKYLILQKIKAMMYIKEVLLQWFIIFLVKKSTDGAIIQNQQIAEELHKPLFKRFENCKVNSSFKDNFWGADLADMQLISKFSKWIRFFFIMCYWYLQWICMDSFFER